MRDYSSHKMGMRIIGLPLLIIGFIFVIIGFASFGTGSFGESRSSMMMFAAGGFMTVIGFGLVSASLTRPVSKYYATEMSPAMEIAGESIGKGLNQSGFGKTSGTKEIIKIKCPHCGYLESEDADFCSKCGKKI